jgi:hypothetical protein
MKVGTAISTPSIPLFGTLGTPPANSAPSNTALPEISGSAPAGSLLTASTGSWNGYPPPSFAYQWKKNTVNIGGETNSTYTSVVGDVGSSITVTVTATNGSGSASATSAGFTVTSTDANAILRTDNSYSLRTDGSRILRAA